MRRHTTVLIAIYALTLSAALSLVSIATYLIGYQGEWGEVFAAYPVRQRWLWLVALLWSLAALVSGAALLRRRAWGRTLYVSAAAVAVIAYFVLQPWVLALSAVPVLAGTSAILLSRLGTRYLTDVPDVSAVSPKRTLLAIAILAVSAIVFTISYQGVTLRLGWMLVVFHRPGASFLAALLGLVVGAILMPKGKRAWAFGMGLMVSVVIMAAAALGYLPYASPFVRLLGPGYREYVIDLKMINTMQVLFGLLGVWMLRNNRVIEPKQPKPPEPPEPLSWPDYR
ncbi:hypothetical protein [Ralstonia flaminis]|jgi:hypothetical protein|uniref:Transmembrane protein n=1 Tax=Ralstonia flaminis TaxID=3058597 RepID=A0ABM9KAS6_9RALS|nr:hypothetical protein [Ralstonia sp. LMG 18101]CAJ0822265.1 hypothetical protein LMG18101_04919 [Ralstonia sp. LMG 18101]